MIEIATFLLRFSIDLKPVYSHSKGREYIASLFKKFIKMSIKVFQDRH